MWVVRWYTAPFGEYLMVDVDGWRAENRVYVFRALDIFVLPSNFLSVLPHHGLCVLRHTTRDFGVKSRGVAWARQRPQLSCKRTDRQYNACKACNLQKAVYAPPRSACSMRLHITCFSNDGDFIKDGNMAQAHISQPVNLACQ